MQQTHQDFSALKQGRGGRISSPELRQTITQSQDFTGLEQSIKPFDLLTLVKRAGKGAGFSSKMVELLEHYMVFTREIDWQKGSQPIVYKSQYNTAIDLGISERHVQRLEKQLFDVGALTWNDSGNCKRYGQRDPKSGKILYAFGVDLTPLPYLKDALENIVHEQQLKKAAWMETKRQISWHRAQIKAILAEMVEISAPGQGALLNSYERIATRFTTSMSLETLRSMLSQHQELYNEALSAMETTYSTRKQNKESCKTDSIVGHKQDTNYNQSNKLDTNSSSSCNGFQESSSRSSALESETIEHGDREVGLEEKNQAPEEPKHPAIASGLTQLTEKQLLNAASERFRAHIPMKSGPMSMDDIVDAAYAMRSDLFISQKSWGRACSHLTRYGAAVCVLLLDQATSREENRVMKPAAYFNAMINRAISGDLHLQKSVMGLLKLEESHDPANTNDPEMTQKRV
jgi:replication initiation protein RepC